MKAKRRKPKRSTKRSMKRPIKQRSKKRLSERPQATSPSSSSGLPSGTCPCHSGKRYSACCQPLHSGVVPESVEALMRSRYAAYALGDADYIIETTHPESSHAQADLELWRADILEFSRSTHFRGLQIISSAEDEVHFLAILYQRVSGGELDCSFSERSKFKIYEERWRYCEGTPMPINGLTHT